MAAKYSVLVNGSVIYSGLRCEVAKRVVANMITNEYTKPTMECKFSVPDAAYSTNWVEHCTLEEALFDIWFELSETIDDGGQSSMHPRYINQPALYLMG